MKGKGVEYLNFSLNKLLDQTFTDFDVVISDHSLNNDIEKLCETWKNKLDIKYFYNESKRGISSANINNAIKNATGEAVKILFQDDFLFDSQSLEIQYLHFFSNHNSWLITACAHTSDGENIVDSFYPKYHDNIHFGNNTISSPSVIMMNRELALEFDENLFWLMDVDYYKRMFDRYGLPSICNYITVINRNHQDQVSNTLATEEVKIKEYNYIKEKYKII
jgi:hypothetical protein